MSDVPQTTARAFRRFARLYSDGSLNVSSEGESFEVARKLLSGSTDDDDTQLVQVEVGIIEWLGRPKLEIVRVDEAELLRALLREARDTHAADLVPNAWADRVDEALKEQPDV